MFCRSSRSTWTNQDACRRGREKLERAPDDVNVCYTLLGLVTIWREEVKNLTTVLPPPGCPPSTDHSHPPPLVWPVLSEGVQRAVSRSFRLFPKRKRSLSDLFAFAPPQWEPRRLPRPTPETAATRFTRQRRCGLNKASSTQFHDESSTNLRLNEEVGSRKDKLMIVNVLIS